MRVHDLLERGEARLLESPQPERARRDAELLLFTTLGRTRAWLLAHQDEPVTEIGADAFFDRIERRLLGEPMQYIAGQTEFFGLQFRVTPDVLIPRPDTEHLVEAALQFAATIATPRIVDIGTGSGAIAVALAHALAEAEVTAIDLSAAALAVAAENAERNGIPGRIRFLVGDLLAPVAHESFDIIVSNPPYVAQTDRSCLPVEVRDFEPSLALFAGRDGLEIYRRLVPSAFALLRTGGFLALEIGQGQHAALRALLQDIGFREIEFKPDLQGILRVVSARRP